MSLTVHYLCAYYSQWAHDNVAPRTQALWDAFKFCRAVKDGTINGYCTVPFRPPVQINKDNIGRAREIFGALVRQGPKDPFQKGAILVPVPSKDSWNTRDFRSLQMLRQSQPSDVQARINPLVRFSEHRPKASEGGARGYDAVKPYIKVDGCIPQTPIILVDDIMTTGGTMLAVRDLLEEHGANVVCGVACGRTTSIAEPSFGMRQFELADHIGGIEPPDIFAFLQNKG